MPKTNKLTNEELTKHFSNPFELVNHAIDLAKNMVGGGHELSDLGDKNAAGIILAKVLKNRESEEKSEALMELEQKKSVAEDKDLPGPFEQAI